MRIREDNRNMVLLVTVTLLAATVACVVALIVPAPGDSHAAYLADQTQVRVVGPAFVPNTNPREHR